MKAPSKELVSAILGRPVGEIHINGNNVEIYPESGIARSIINKYKLMHLMKEWALIKHEYTIETGLIGDNEIVDYCICNVRKYTDVANYNIYHTYDFKNEVEAITQSCEWILKEKS